MKKLLLATSVALLMAGCAEELQEAQQDLEEFERGLRLFKEALEEIEGYQSSVETIDLDDNETRNKIIVEAIDEGKLQERGEEGEELRYAPDQNMPYTGWAKTMHGDPFADWRVRVTQYKDGKEDGLAREWRWKDGKEVE